MGNIDSTAAEARSPVLARLRAALPLLAASERRVVEMMVKRPSDVADWSTLELASAAGTSPASVIRACQSLGFRGFQHLRLELARNPIDVPIASDDQVAATFDAAIDSLVATKEGLSRDAFERAVSAVAQAGRVLVVGNGFSGPPAQDAAMRFLTAGRTADAPTDVLTQQFSARLLVPGDVCVAISYSGANAQTLNAGTAAREGGATLIAVTSFTHSPLTRIADIVLITGPVVESHEVDPFLSRLGQSVVLHALHAAILSEPNATRVAARMRDVVVGALTEDARE
jgi:DNA-binding MurR/RpiR family transcriptional regulator